MTPQEVTSLVEREISEYAYEPPDFRPIGTLWSVERVQEEMTRLRESLVDPRLIRVINRDDYENHYECHCWIVAYADNYCVVFDPDIWEFMLAAATGDAENKIGAIHDMEVEEAESADGLIEQAVRDLLLVAKEEEVLLDVGQAKTIRSAMKEQGEA